MDLAVRTTVENRPIVEANIEGRRVVDISFVWNEIHRTFLDLARLSGCHFRSWKLTNSRRRGFLTQLFFHCEVCHHNDSIWSEPIDAANMDVNSGATVGTLTTGISFSQLEELCAAMNVPCMSEKTYI